MICPLPFFLSPDYAETQLGIAFYRTTWTQADETGPVAEALLDDFETEQGLPWRNSAVDGPAQSLFDPMKYQHLLVLWDDIEKDPVVI